MTASEQWETAHIRLLPIRCRRLVVGSGDRTECRVVYCPPEERSVELGCCERCSHCWGLEGDEVGGPRHVVCDRVARTYPDAGPVWRVPGKYSYDVWLSDNTPVGAILEGTTLCVTDDLSMEALAELLMASNRSGVPVVDDDGQPIGIVTRTDVVRVLHDAGFSWEAAWTDPNQQEELGFSETGLPRTLVGEAMTPMVFSVAESAPVSQAAALLAFEGVRQLVVTAQDGTAVGLVSALDIASWMARLSGYALGATRHGGKELAEDGSGDESQAEGAGVASSAPEADDHEEPERPPSGTVSVLLFDQDEKFLRQAEELGRAQLLHVLSASSEAEAVNLARTTWIDGAIVSVGTDGDGAHFLARLLRSLPGMADLPVALLGQHRDLVDRFAAARVRATMFLEKPLNADILAQAARHLAMVRRAPPPRILLVESEPALPWVGDSLRRAGMHVARLSSPERILDMLDSERPDLIVTSTALGGDVSAMDLCRVIRAHPPWQELTTVVLQPSDGPCQRSQCFEAGCDDYLEPPLDAHELLTRVRARLARAQVLRERADYDGLTGLLTRRGFDETLEMRLADARRYNQPLALGLIDLDDLKAINDCHGHLVGDRVLRALGSVLGNHFRSGDVRARVGGDEFVVALAGESPVSASLVLDRALREFCGVQFDAGSGVSFAASFTAGVAVAPEDGTSREALLRAADRRLYAAKRAGKCQISASQ